MEISEAAGSQDWSSPEGCKQPCSSLLDAAPAQGWCFQGGLRVKALSKAPHPGKSHIPVGFQSGPKICGAFLSASSSPAPVGP